MQSRGIIVVVSGPSGAGKSTLVRGLLSEPGVQMSVSCTTRQPRRGEADGKDYFFLSREEFERRIEQGEFAEHAEVFGNLYGTPKAFVEEKAAAGFDVVMDIDVQGARQLKDVYPDGIFVFVLPPSRRELERRLRDRGTESAEKVQARLTIADEEVKSAELYDYVIVNDALDEAVALLKAIRSVEKARMQRVLEDFSWWTST